MPENDGSSQGFSEAQRAELSALIEQAVKGKRGFLGRRIDRLRERADGGIERARQFVDDATPSDPGPGEEWDEDTFEGWAAAKVQRHRFVFSIAAVLLVGGIMTALFLPGLSLWVRVPLLAVFLAAPPLAVGLLRLQGRGRP